MPDPRAGAIGTEYAAATYDRCAACDERVTHWSLDFSTGTRMNRPCRCVFWHHPPYQNRAWRPHDPPRPVVFIGWWSGLGTSPTQAWVEERLVEAGIEVPA